MTSVLIADDHPMVREGLEAMLSSEGDFDVVGLSADGDDAARKAAELRPDIVLSDVRMPGTDGFALLERTRALSPAPRVVLLAGMPLKEEEDRARAGGAAGYLPKDVDQDRLSSALREVAANPGVFVRDEFQAAPSILTMREMDVLRLLAKGMQRDQIAEALGIGPESVKTHLKGIMNKLGRPNAPSAVGRAYEMGILRA